MKPVFRASTLTIALVVCIAYMGGVRYWQLEEEMKMPVPEMDFSVPASLATVYWIKPPHADIAVLMNAMFNTPGPVTIYLGGDYELFSPIKMHAEDALIGEPFVIFYTSKNFDYDYILHTVDCRDCLIQNTGWETYTTHPYQPD